MQLTRAHNSAGRRGRMYWLIDDHYRRRGPSNPCLVAILWIIGIGNGLQLP